VNEPSQSSFELRSTQDANFPTTTENQESRNDIIKPSQISVEPAFSQDAIKEVPPAAGNQESKKDLSKSTAKTVMIPQEETAYHFAASTTLVHLSVRSKN